MSVLGVQSSENLQGLGESINAITRSWPSMAIRRPGGTWLLREWGCECWWVADFRHLRHHGCRDLTVQSKGPWLSCRIPHQVLRQTLCRPGMPSQWRFSIPSGRSLAMEVHMLHLLCSLWHCQTTTWGFSQDAQVQSTRKSSPSLAQAQGAWIEEGVLETVTYQGSAWVQCLEAWCMGQSGNLLCNQRGPRCCLAIGSCYVANAILYLRKSASDSRGI